MPKKHPPRPSGWPHGGKLPPREAKLDAVRRVADRIANKSVTDAEFDRYMRRLEEMLRDWREFRFVRPDMLALQRALRELPEDEFRALLNPEKGKRRSGRARAHVFQRVFDFVLLEMLTPALSEAANRAGSPDDVGALAVALFSLKGLATGTGQIEANPLLAVLLDVSFRDFHELSQAIKEVEAQASQGAPGAAADDPERLKRLQEAVAKHPAFQRDAERRAFRLAHHLLQYVERGIVRAHLSEEEFGSLLGDVRQVAQRVAAAGGGASEGESAEDAPAASPADLMARLRAFAADAANDGAFRRFNEALATEAQEAAASAHPLAEQLTALADFCRVTADPSSPIRVIICQASLARLRRAAAAAEARSTHASGVAPPA